MELSGCRELSLAETHRKEQHRWTCLLQVPISYFLSELSTEFWCLFFTSVLLVERKGNGVPFQWLLPHFCRQRSNSFPQHYMLLSISSLLSPGMFNLHGRFQFINLFTISCVCMCVCASLNSFCKCQVLCLATMSCASSNLFIFSEHSSVVFCSVTLSLYYGGRRYSFFWAFEASQKCLAETCLPESDTCSFIVHSARL